MAAPANAREIRRRRILERGSDRLALITGQIQSLPSSEGMKDLSPPPSISNDLDLPSHVADQSSDSPDKDKWVGSTLQHRDPDIDARTSGNYRSNSEPILSECNTMEAAVASASEDRKAQSPLIPSEGQDSSISMLGRDQYNKPPFMFLGSFSLNQLSSAISESGKARLCFSATIAFLVIISCIGFPFLGQGLLRVVFGFRPLYLVLLTNATVVLGRLLFTKQKGPRATVRGENQVTLPEGQSSVERISKILEAGLVIQKVMAAIFMDCSVFAVIVVSGFSFVQQFRS